MAVARISVLGGTGYAGSAIVAEASARGHDVTALSRSAPAEQRPGVTYLTGSVLDAETLDSATTGQDVVIEAVSPRGDMAGRVEGLLDALMERAPRAGFRLGVIGGASSLLVREGGPRLFDVGEVAPEVRPEIETGLALLDKLQQAPAELDWFYVSPPASFGAWSPAPDTGTYRLSEDVLLTAPDGTSTISAADLARAVVDEIERPQFRRRRFHAAH